ncbi:MAG: brp-like protein [Nocardioides sp.]|nr:brp-like protein [Nocardioides sp.]
MTSAGVDRVRPDRGRVVGLLTPAPRRPVRASRRGPALTAAAATTVSRTVVVVVILGSWLLPPWVVLVAGLVAGLPHGAVDHLVPRWWLGARAPRMVAVLAVYATTAVAAYVAFRAWPFGAVVLFLVVSAWHFGSGETGFADLRAGRMLPARVLRGATHVLVVLALPAMLHPDGVLPLLGAVLGTPVDLDASTRTALTVAAGVALVGALCVAAVELAAGRRAEALDLALLLALAVVVSPLAAFGAYFGAWHSVRHLARTLVDDPGNTADLAAGRLGPALRRFARSAAAPTAVSLVVVGAMAVTADGWGGFASHYLALLAGLTVPHLVVVAWADRRRVGART